MKLFQRHTFRKVVAETNIFDIAIGLAVAGVFIKVIDSFVTYILTPPLGALLGGESLANLSIDVTLFSNDTPILFRYGMFLDACIQFLLVFLLVYWSARIVLRIKRRGAIDNNHVKECRSCCMSIPLHAKKCPYCQEEERDVKG